MVKPVFKALNEIKAAPTAEQAHDIAAAFLRSADALHVDDGRAGTFVKSLGDVFARHNATHLYGALLESAVADDKKLSFGLRTSLTFALTDHKAAVGYAEQSREVHIRNAIILRDIKATQTQGKNGSFTQSDDGKGTDVPLPEISAARTPEFLKMAVNDTLVMGAEITNPHADEFMRVLNVAFRKTKTPLDQKIEILGMIADATSEKDKLHGLAVDESNRLIRDSEGAAPRTAHTGGGSMDLGMK